MLAVAIASLLQISSILGAYDPACTTCEPAVDERIVPMGVPVLTSAQRRSRSLRYIIAGAPWPEDRRVPQNKCQRRRRVAKRPSCMHVTPDPKLSACYAKPE